MQNALVPRNRMSSEQVRAFAHGRPVHYGQEDDPALLLRAQALLAEAESCHGALGPWRKQYREGRDAARGYQWDRMMQDERGQWMREKDYLESKGRKPLVVNLIGSQLNQIVGQFRQNKSQRDIFPVQLADGDVVEMMNAARRSMRRENAADELEADQFYTHALAGRSAFRSVIERGRAGFGLGRSVVTEYSVHPTRLFYNLDVADRRMNGLRLVGELHDLTPAELVYRLCRDEAEAQRVLGYYGLQPGVLDHDRQRFGGYGGAYAHVAGAGPASRRHGFQTFEGISFRNRQGSGGSAASGKLRVIEVWACEYEWSARGLDPLAYDPEAQMLGLVSIPEGEGPLPPHLDPARPGGAEGLQMEQNARAMMGLPPLEVRGPELMPVWRYYFLTPEGRVIRYGTSTYWHGEHPFTLGSALHLDGETWGIVQNIHDPQRWLNAALSHIDHAIRTGQKGTTFVDKAVREASGLSFSDFNEALTRGDAAVELLKGQVDWKEILYNLPQQDLPKGLFEVVSMIPQLLERISGVTEAAAGIIDGPKRTATEYERSVIQSGVATYIYQDSYFECLQRKDRKEVRLLQQALDRPAAFYDEKSGEHVEYDPARARALRFDVAMGQAADTPTLRLAREQQLREDVQMFGLPPEIYYKNSGRPDAPALLRDITEMRQQQAIQERAMLEAADEAGLLDGTADGP